MSGAMKPLPAAERYAAGHPDPVVRENMDGNPVIVGEFTDRWRTGYWRKRASVSWLRKLRAAGVTHVAIEVAPARTADFAVGELLA